MRYFVSAMLFVFLLASPAALTAAESENDESFTLQSQRQVGQIDRVNIVLEASGDVLAKTASGDATERVAVSVSARRDYDEKMLSVGDASDKALRSVRYYNEAAANVKRGTSEQKPTLRDDRRLIGVEIVGGKATPFSPQGTLDIDELELVTAAGESLPVDQILPATPMKIGQKWKVANDTVALLLGLEQVTANSVEVVLKEVAPDVARMELEGQVEGKLYGAANQVSLKAKCRFDRRAGRIDWLAMRLKQNRDPGLVEDGLDFTVLVQMKIARKDSSDALTDAVLKDLTLKPSDDLCKIIYQRREGGWQLTHDRSWFHIEHFRDLEEFHRLVQGQDIGMCKISPLPQTSAAKMPSLIQFQSEVQKALGKNFGEYIRASQSVDDTNNRILKVQVKGTDNETPIHWIYYHISDPQGHQVSIAFRVPEKQVEAFAQADEQFAGALRFVESEKK